MTPFEIFFVVAAVLSAGSTAYQQRQTAKARREVAEYNETVNKQNAAYKIREAKETADRASLQRQRELKKQKYFKSSQEASIAKSGILLEGTPLNLLTNTVATQKEDIGEMMRQEQYDTQGLLWEAKMLEYGGEMQTTIAENNLKDTTTSGLLNVATTAATSYASANLNKD